MITTTPSTPTDDIGMSMKQLSHNLAAAYPLLNAELIGRDATDILGKLIAAGSSTENRPNGRVASATANLIAYHFDMRHGDRTSRILCDREPTYVQIAADGGQLGWWHIDYRLGEVPARLQDRLIARHTAPNIWAATTIGNGLVQLTESERADLYAGKASEGSE